MGGRGGTRSEEPGGQSCRERGQEHRGCGAQDGGGRAAATAQLEHAALEVEIFGFFSQFIPQIFGPILAIRQGSDRAAVEILPVPGEGIEKEERRIQDGEGISPERPGTPTQPRAHPGSVLSALLGDPACYASSCELQALPLFPKFQAPGPSSLHLPAAAAASRLPPLPLWH